MSTATIEKPTAIPVNVDGIPRELTRLKRWVAWRYVWDEKRKRWTKPPFNAATGEAGSSTNPATWNTFSAAVKASKINRNAYDGIGAALGDAGWGLTLCGIDLDDCRNPITGELNELARDIIETVETYTEVSPSGTGVKLFGLCNRRLLAALLPAGHRTINKAETVEIYSCDRYFTVTGNCINDIEVADCCEELAAVWRKYIGSEQTPQPQIRSETQRSVSGTANDSALAAMLCIKPADNENDGSHRLFAVCCRAVERGLADDVAVDTIRAYSDQCPFPAEWSDNDILDRLRDAERRAKRGSATADNRHTTDVGNAERFSAQHGADVRYCHVWGKWLVWDGRRWAEDTTGEIMRRAKRTARSIYVEASNADDKQEREILGKWAALSERRDRLAAMIDLSKSEQPIPVSVESLDSDAWLLNCQNGTIDLRSGELREHRRDDYLTKVAPVEYPDRATGDPELWLAVLERIFAGRKQLIQFVQRLMGASLVGEVQEQILPILYGKGANGKTVLIETWCGLLGSDFAMKAPHDLLMASKTGRHPTELADLRGKRLVAAVETEDGGRLSEARVKELTGGDKIRARRMREDFWEFPPSHTVVLATNHKPVVRGTDHAIWRRLRLIPFSVTIPDHQQDKELTTKLKAEWPRILQWAVKGCSDWQTDGLKAPDEVMLATKEYRSDSDVLEQFIEECCIVGQQYEAGASELYSAYKSWAEKRYEWAENQTRFGNQLAEREYEKRKTNGVIVYRGIAVRSGKDTLPE
jgi:putative DNA primase/helicase